MLIALRSDITSREDLIRKMDTFFQTSFDLIMSCVLDGKSISLYSLSLHLLLFSLLSNHLLLTNSPAFEKYILVFMEVAERYSATAEGLAMQMWSNLSEIASKQEDKPRVEVFARRIFQHMLARINNNNSDVYYEALNVFFVNFRDAIFQD